MKYLVLSIVPPHLPLVEGLIGFSVLGIVLIGLSLLDKWGLTSINEGVIIGGLTIGFILGIGFLLFKSIFLLGI